MTDTGTEAALAAQYERFPYPARDPRDEARRLVVGSPSHLREIDHWVFRARRPAGRPLRALFAGGGTGDGAIMLAAQLLQAGRPGHVTHLDRSSHAARIAAARAEARGLNDIAFVEATLPDLPDETWDYIDCCGVLHHLDDPLVTLRALAARLHPGGGMGLMVYAPLGRAGVYELQSALRSLAPPDDPPASRLETARRVMRHLPATAWLRANRNFDDHLRGGDSGLYDLLLNPRDRAFDVTQFNALIEAAGLKVAALIEPARYDPDLLLPDPRLRARTGALSPLERAALAENLAGNMATHIAYVVHAAHEPAAIDPTDPDAVPVARETPASTLASRITHGVFPFEAGPLTIPLPLPHQAASLLGLVDGRRPVADIRALASERGIDAATFDRAWPATFAGLQSANRLLLAAPARA